jgi:hypothetical protein
LCWFDGSKVLRPSSTLAFCANYKVFPDYVSNLDLLKEYTISSFALKM